jgi:uncharacterized protein YneF (UPF0154 family)
MKTIFLLVVCGVVALALGWFIQMSVVRTYVVPICTEYGVRNNLTYSSYDSPNDDENGSSGYCVFKNRTGEQIQFSLLKLRKDAAVNFAASMALDMGVTVPLLFFVLIGATMFLARKR